MKLTALHVYIVAPRKTQNPIKSVAFALHVASGFWLRTCVCASRETLAQRLRTSVRHVSVSCPKGCGCHVYINTKLLRAILSKHTRTRIMVYGTRTHRQSILQQLFETHQSRRRQRRRRRRQHHRRPYRTLPKCLRVLCRIHVAEHICRCPRIVYTHRSARTHTHKHSHANFGTR